MKYDCKVIKGLLPQYINQTLKGKKAKKAEAHLRECSSCRKLYEDSVLQRENRELKQKITNKTDQKIPHVKSAKKVVLFCVIILIILLLLSSVISYIKFEVLNPFTSGVGIIRILVTDKEYVVIQNNPKVILAQPDDAWEHFITYMEQENYIYLEEERVGNRCIFEKDHQKVAVTFRRNDYYSQWTWLK